MFVHKIGNVSNSVEIHDAAHDDEEYSFLFAVDVDDIDELIKILQEAKETHKINQ